MTEKRVVKTSEKIISSTVKDLPKKNIFKDNPITQRIKKVGGSIKAIPIGIFLLLVGLYLTYASVINVKEVSKVVERLKSIPAKEASSDNELAFYDGSPELITENSFEYSVCERSYTCTEPYEFTTQKIENVIYISAEFQRYEQKETKRTETKTRIVDGKEISDEVEITELVEDWETKQTNENWYGFKLGKITIDNPEKANRQIKTSSQTINNVYIPNLETPYIQRDQSSEKVGSTRLIVTTYSLPSKLNLVAEISSGKVNTDNTFIITEQDKDTLVNTLRQSEKSSRTTLRFIAWLALTLGIMTVLGPILSIIEIIPLVGKAANFAALVIGAILSAIVVFVGVIIVKFWWVFVILIIVLIGAGIYLVTLSKSGPKETIATKDIENK